MNNIKTRKYLGENIKYYRYKLNYSQEQLSEKCGFSNRYISDLETCRSTVKLDTLTKIAEVLKIETYKLLMPTDNLPPLPKSVNTK